MRKLKHSDIDETWTQFERVLSLLFQPQCSLASLKWADWTGESRKAKSLLAKDELFLSFGVKEMKHQKSVSAVT